LRKSQKIIVALLISLLFLISGMISSSAYTINKKTEKENCNNKVEIQSFSRKITVYRCGIDGIVTPVEIEVNNLEDINEAISEKCEELLTNDVDFKGLNFTMALGIFTFVKSHGRGIHLKPFKRSNTIFCRYPRDSKAYTTLISLFGGGRKTISGPHSVISFRFVGFKWWIGRTSILGFFMRTGYVGYSSFTAIRGL
jgi:hypothetical protein